MIELDMMRRMVRRGLLLAPAAMLLVWVFAGDAAVIGMAAGTILALGNLYVAGRVIGGVAENSPHLLLAGAMGAFIIGMGGLLLAAFTMKNIEWLNLPAAGIALIATHLILVMWEAAQQFLKMPSDNDPHRAST